MKNFTRTQNLLSGLMVIHKYYMGKINDFPLSEQIGLILYSSFIRENTIKFNFVQTIEEEYFKDAAFKMDEIYSAAVSNQPYKDGTENLNTVYNILFGLMMEIDETFNEEYSETDEQ